MSGITPQRSAAPWPPPPRDSAPVVARRIVHNDPKPARRIVNPQAGRQKVLFEGRCRACGVSGSLNRAHLVAKGQRGDDVDANIVPLCGSGTTGCHGALTDHRPGWPLIAARLRENLTQAEIDYCVAKKGWDWLDRTYPRRETLA